MPSVVASADRPTGGDQGRTLRYMPQLDALRAIAVGLVFLSHWVDKTGVTGMLGVRLFFVLSGFLITSILLRVRTRLDEGQVKWSVQLRHFYARRFFRLFPALLLLIVVLLILDFSTIRQTWVWHLTYLSNVYFTLQGSYDGGVAPLWSLSVEEQFYLVWPVLILLGSRRFHVPAILAFVVCAVAWRFMTWKFYPGLSGGYVLPFKWLDGLGLGALLAVCIESPDWSWIGTAKLLRFTRNVGVPLFVLCLGARVLDRWGATTALLLDLAASLAFVWLTANAASGFRGLTGRMLEFKPLLYTGRISYGLYLYHAYMPDSLKWVERQLGIPLTQWDIPQALFDSASVVAGPFATRLSAVLMLLLYSLATVAVATASWFLWERPISRLRRYAGYESALPVESLATPIRTGIP